MNTQTFSAIIESNSDHKKLLAVRNEAWYQDFLHTFKDGEEVTVFITDRKPKRTDGQNRFLWMYYREIAKETGYSAEEVHEWARGKFLTEKIATVFGQPTRIRASTATLNTSEFSEYIERIMAETGIQPPPLEI